MPVKDQLQLHAVQAQFGDCLLVESRAGGSTRYILIDGGPSGTYTPHLRPALAQIKTGRGLVDLMVLSHIDNDHVTGLLELVTELQASSGAPASDGALPAIARLWHNSFAQAVGSADIEPAVRRALAGTARAGIAMPVTSGVMHGVQEGDALRAMAMALKIPMNEGFTNAHVLVGSGKPMQLDGLEIVVVGPNTAELESLHGTWLKWLASHRQRGVAGEEVLSVAADQSVPNLSSIAMLVTQDSRSLLLTGDGRGDRILDGMKEAGVLDAKGHRHVSVLKMPHHGSARNATRTFLDALTADVYVISANGRYGNPDYECLVNVVESAHDAGRAIDLAMTNRTPSYAKLLKSHSPKKFGYSARLLDPGQSVLTIDVAPAGG